MQQSGRSSCVETTWSLGPRGVVDLRLELDRALQEPPRRFAEGHLERMELRVPPIRRSARMNRWRGHDVRADDAGDRGERRPRSAPDDDQEPEGRHALAEHLSAAGSRVLSTRPLRSSCAITRCV